MNIGKFKWLFGRNSEFWPTNMKTGMWAWVGHRLTGIILVVYVFMHLSFLSTASVGDKSFENLMKTTAEPAFVMADFLLVCAVIYHAMNGFRVILFDMGIGIRRQKLVFWVMMAIAAIIVVVAFYVLFNEGLFEGEWF
jgi:succinate dehydrogenase / fumarate reductase cytochrome b subunit